MAVDSGTVEPFAVALQRLKHDRGLSYRALADRTAEEDEAGKGLLPSHISQLANGTDWPAPAAIELIAGALNLEPSYFAEYRLAQARLLLDERGPGGLTGAVEHLERFCEVAELSGKPKLRLRRAAA